MGGCGGCGGGGCERIRRDGEVEADGLPSGVLSRRRARDDEESWSVVVRPYRPKANESLLQDVGSDTTCLLPGNRVLMADGSWRAIETIAVGERVQTMSGPARVTETETTRLGMTRKVIELRGVGDECLIMSDDHPLWVSRREASGASREWWGTYNVAHLAYEMRTRNGLDFDSPPLALNFDIPEQVAHVSGWLHVRPIFHHMDPSTPLHHLVVGTGCSFIAEGFPLLSHNLFEQGPEQPWCGLQRDDEASEFVERLRATADSQTA